MINVLSEVKIVVWGAGKRGNEFVELINNYYSQISIVAIVDSYNSGIRGYDLYKPEDLKKLAYDMIIIACDKQKDIDEIYKKILDEKLVVSQDKIYTWFNFINLLRKKNIQKKFYRVDDSNYEELMKFLESNPLSVRNCWSNTSQTKYRLYKDTYDSLPYVWFYGKRMYYPKKYWNEKNNEENQYIINVEENDQYEGSPHLYTYENHSIKEGDVIVDAGVCEGNFALKYIDKVSKAYLIEPDELWGEALERSFYPYREKVIFTKKFLTDVNGINTITLDKLLHKEEKVDFIKMDIEGEECRALLGGINVIKKLKPLLSICSYHREFDERNIRFILEAMGYTTTVSKGLMFFLWDKNIDYTLDFRKGIVYGD